MLESALPTVVVDGANSPSLSLLKVESCATKEIDLSGLPPSHPLTRLLVSNESINSALNTSLQSIKLPAKAHHLREFQLISNGLQ